MSSYQCSLSCMGQTFCVEKECLGMPFPPLVLMNVVHKICKCQLELVFSGTLLLYSMYVIVMNLQGFCETVVSSTTMYFQSLEQFQWTISNMPTNPKEWNSSLFFECCWKLGSKLNSSCIGNVCRSKYVEYSVLLPRLFFFYSADKVKVECLCVLRVDFELSASCPFSLVWQSLILLSLQSANMLPFLSLIFRVLFQTCRFSIRNKKRAILQFWRSS